ncbi:ABC transporter ATP-binding protein [Actinomadura sp. KC06]|uniref:ABC transporter ATP-binding protein n=1 Tax=Actinomadura sp. KC06 TaxID=2530369 RepID=UPI00104C8764|nr:ABC transporter ATP-binding protein [Actinomadura sp. KC06]TDD31062.1 ABC transporter ATP-binding protein [Actinomadura sp. KC06]
MSIVGIDGLTKRFGGVTAVDRVSLDIGDGEFVALLGPSGCGKTTTLRCVAGLESPDEGTIRLGSGTVVDRSRGYELPPHKRDIGMVFQSYALWPHMSVIQNVSYPLRLKRQRKQAAQAKAMEALELVGLANYAARSVSALSGGQQQRVALARALVREPSVLLLDEPLSNLDAALRTQMRGELKRIHEQTGSTMIYVTHDQEEAVSMSDRIAVMHDGRAVQIGSPREVFDAPSSRWVAEFLGYENILPGLVEAAGDGHARVRPDGWDTSLTCTRAAGCSAGDRVRLAIRSTALLFDHFDSSSDFADRPNRLDVKVLRSTFLGTATDHEVSAFGSRLVAKQIVGGGRPAAPQGADAVVWIEPGQIALIPANDEPADVRTADELATAKPAARGRAS